MSESDLGIGLVAPRGQFFGLGLGLEKRSCLHH